MNLLRSFAVVLLLSKGLFADEAPRTPFDAYTGTIKSIDATQGTLDLTLGGDLRRDQAFNLQRDTRVTIDSKDAKLSDLKAGMAITVQAKKGAFEVVAITTEGRSARALIDSVDAQARTISLKTEGAPRVLNVAKTVEVLITGKPATLADVKPGSATLKYSADGAQIVSIVTGTQRDGERPAGRDPVAREPVVRGLFKSLNATTGELVVNIREEGREGVLTVVMDNEAAIVKGREVLKPADLKVGTEVTVVLSEDKKVARRIQIVIRDGDR